MSSSDLELLARYSRQGAEEAFAEIVRRHAGLVYGTALRVTRLPAMAEDVAQSVFLDLARNAKKLRQDTVLGAWLYTVTRNTATKAVRGETRRLIREQAAYAMNAAEESSPPPAELEPLLDDAMAALAETDRAVIVLRFFQDKSLADVGAALGISTNAAQKRLSRAVDQMRGFFSQRGIATGSVAITTLLAANTAQAVPAGLAASICASVHATIPLTTAATLIKAATMTTLQKSLIGLTLVAAIGVAVRETHENKQLREQLKTSQASAGATGSIQAESSDATPDRPATRTVATKSGGKLTPAQFEAKLQSLAEMGISRFGRANMNRLIAEASLEDIPRLLAVVDEKLPNKLRKHFHEAWIERWAAADAPAAFAYAVGIDNSEPANNRESPFPFHTYSASDADLDLPALALDSVLGHWADQDLAGAAKALEAYTGRNREEACKTLADLWVEKDPEAALKWTIAALPEDANQMAVNTRELARKWAETDPAAAWKWALALPDSATKGLFITDLAPAVASASPVEIANEVAKMEPGEDQNHAARGVAESWARTDPRAASEWAAQFPDPVSRSETMQIIALFWAGQDPAAARAWVQSLPAEDDLGEIWWDLTRGLADKNPEQAVETLKNVTDPDKRDWGIRDIGQNWFRKDPAAARQWLQSVGQSEEQIQWIQKQATDQ